jgi:uncharacterized protein YjiS (DUF1127 family)
MSGHVTHGSAFAREASANRRVPAPGWLAQQHMAQRWLGMVARMTRAIEERRILSTLDDRMLADIGLNRLEAEREATRAPWHLPGRN